MSTSFLIVFELKHSNTIWHTFYRIMHALMDSNWVHETTPDRPHSIDERGSKTVKNRVFDCHLSPNWRQKAIENTVFFTIFNPRSSIVKSVFDCRLSGVETSKLNSLKLRMTRYAHGHASKTLVECPNGPLYLMLVAIL